MKFKMAVFREHGQGKTGSEETSKSAREGKSSILGRESGKKVQAGLHFRRR